MKYKYIILMVIFLSSCATIKSPGANVTDSFAKQWGCNPVEVRQDINRYKSNLSAGRVYIPKVGWSACDLMARNGKPEKIDRQSGYGSQSATWWYGTGQYNDLWMITLNRSSGQWVVDYVSR